MAQLLRQIHQLFIVGLRMYTCLCTYVCKHCENQSSQKWQFHCGGRRARVTSGIATCCCQQVGRAPGYKQIERECESKNVTDCVIRKVNTRWVGRGSQHIRTWLDRTQPYWNTHKTEAKTTTIVEPAEQQLWWRSRCGIAVFVSLFLLFYLRCQTDKRATR